MLTSVKDGLGVRERRLEAQSRMERGAVGGRLLAAVVSETVHSHIIIYSLVVSVCMAVLGSTRPSRFPSLCASLSLCFTLYALLLLSSPFSPTLSLS